MDYTQMTIEELEQKNTEYMAQIDALRADHDELAAVLDLKYRERMLIDKFGGLSESELDTLKGMSQAAGVESVPVTETVSVPGETTL